MEAPTLGEVYGAAIEITDPVEAKRYFELLVTGRMLQNGGNRASAEKIERLNIGYFAGHYGHADRLRVEKLYGAAHPFFGSAFPLTEAERTLNG